MPHPYNKEQADFLNIVTASGKDLKMTMNHILPAGVCGILSLPLAFATQGKVYSLRNVF